MWEAFDADGTRVLGDSSHFPIVGITILRLLGA
jgi:hypothetical protein